MKFERGNLGYFLAFIIIGAILGASLGNLLVKLFPAISFIKENLTEPVGFNFEVVSFSLKLNFSAIIGLVTGIFIFRKV